MPTGNRWHAQIRLNQEELVQATSKDVERQSVIENLVSIHRSEKPRRINNSNYIYTVRGIDSIACWLKWQ